MGSSREAAATARGGGRGRSRDRPRRRPGRQQHSPKEAAYILGVNNGTLRTRLFQGRKRLKNMLGIRDEV